jgi:hypothetical protein
MGQSGRSVARRPNRPGNEKAPREPWPKPQPSRDSRPIGVGPGTQLRLEACQWPKPLAGCDPKIADGPKTASPRLREDSASPKTRRSDYRSTIPKDPRPIFRPSPAPSVSRWLQVTRTQVPMRLSPRRALHPGPPPGFPCGVPGKVDRALDGGNLWTCLFFATDDRVFASRPPWFNLTSDRVLHPQPDSYSLPKG